MDARIAKLVRKGLDPSIAQILVKARLDTPRKIKAAPIAELTRIPGIGKATADKIKAAVAPSAKSEPKMKPEPEEPTE